jgi:hypothetical protein
MNDDRQPTDWPDDRLAAAFRARADARPTPSDLSATTIDRIRRVPRTGPTRDRFVRLGGLVAAAAVVAFVAVALVYRPTTGPIGSAAPTTFGLPVLSVAEANAIRDGGVDEREIAVHGFLATFGPMPCPPPTTDFTTLNNPTRLWCESAQTWVMEQPEVLVSRTSTSVSARPPSGPAFKPGLALVDTTGLGLLGESDVPVEVVFIGHFDDRRADLCPTDVRVACRDTFIVDRIDRGTIQTVTLNDQAAPGQTDSEIDALISRVDSSLRIISRRVVAIENLGLTEPVYQATPSGTPSYVSSAAWIVTALPPVDAGGRVIARTFVIFDGTDIISEITRNGPAQVALGEAASPSPGTTSTSIPSPSLGPTPSPTAAQSGQATLSTLLAAPITVSQAIDHRDNHLDDTELAVIGYYIVPNIVLDCAVDVSSPISPHCEDSVTWLAEQQPADLSAVGGLTPPTGPKLNVAIRAGTAFGLVPITPKASVSSVVVLGHFDDRRAETCAEVMPCRLEFVVDRVEDAGGSMPLLRVDSQTQSAKETPEAVSARILRDVGLALDSWLVVVDGSSLPSIDPAVIQYASELADAKVVWIARRLLLEDGRLVVRSAYTADKSDIVVAETAGHGFELPAYAAHVEDTEHVLIGTRSLTDTESARLDWTRVVDPAGTASAEIAEVPGRAGDIAVRWMAPACQPSLRVFGHGNGVIPGEVAVLPVLPTTGCSGADREWTIVIEFRDPIRASVVEIMSLSGG